MKSTHNKAEQVQKEIKYPCLMVGTNTGTVVLFYSYESGTVVATTTKSAHTLGYYSNIWHMPDFTPLPQTESITLSND